MAEVDLSNIDELLKEAKAFIRSTDKKICKDCEEGKTLYQNGRCKECHLIWRKLKDSLLKDKEYVKPDGYTYAYDDDGKIRAKHRIVMERLLGRKLLKHEAVLFRDNDKTNCDPANLLLSFRGGTPLQFLKCTNCDTVGEFIFDPPTASQT